MSTSLKEKQEILEYIYILYQFWQYSLRVIKSQRTEQMSSIAELYSLNNFYN